MRLATSLSRLSPTSCPRLSLMSLNRSRSTYLIAPSLSARSAWRSAWGGAVPKECPAEQPRQWVVVGQIGQAGLGLFTPRDVAHHPREQPPPPETDFADRHLQRKHRSILAQALDFAGTGTDYLARSGFEVMADIAVVPAVRLGYQHGDILSGDFRGGITEGARRGRI